MYVVVGTVDCTESTGLFCNAESNMCRSYTIPTCNDTSAQVANVFEVAGSKCACGLDTVCSLAAGSFCYAARSDSAAVMAILISSPNKRQHLVVRMV